MLSVSLTSLVFFVWLQFGPHRRDAVLPGDGSNIGRLSRHSPEVAGVHGSRSQSACRAHVPALQC